MSAGSAGPLQSHSITSTTNPKASHIRIHLSENTPWRQAKTLSPGDKVFAIVASQPPVPVDGNTKIWGLFVAKMDFRPANNFGIASANAGDRWSTVGKS